MFIQTKELKKAISKIRSILDNEKKKDIFSAAVQSGIMNSQALAEAFQLWGTDFIVPADFIKLSYEEIMNNPYLRDIKIKNQICGSAAITRRRIIEPDTLMFFDEKSRDPETFKIRCNYCYCDSRLSLPMLTSANGKYCWMTVEPTEIVSFNHFIQSASGKVLLLGCGLGYLAYMLSLNPNVDEIVIVDNNPDVISLFKEQIYPQFIHQNVKVIQCDALDFLNCVDLSEYNCVNADIWHDTLDMLGNYLKMLVIEQSNPTVTFSYWLEKELKTALQTSILKYIAGVNDINQFMKTIAQNIVDPEEICSLADIKRILALNNFREVMLKWYDNHHDIFDELEQSNIALFNKCNDQTGIFSNKE